MAGELRVTRDLAIPPEELHWRTSTPGGPGGQHANTSRTRVELRWSVAESSVLTEEQRARVRTRLASRLTEDGVLVLRSAEHRSQHRNRDAVAARLATLLRHALEPPKPRRPTRPGAAAVQRRLRAKRRRSDLKQLRRPPEA